MANKLERIKVLYCGKRVGFLRYLDGRTLFAYDSDWLGNGFSISPRSLPLENRVFAAEPAKFGGFFGVFADSLPDGWGTLATIKYLRNKGASYLGLNPLEKLSLIGKDGLGGLSYLPTEGPDIDEWAGAMDVFRESICAIEGEETKFLDEIFAHESSTGGAKPKAHIRFNGEEWK